MSDTITVKYSCSECGLHRVECAVEERGPEQTVVEWMDKVTWALSRDHDRLSPGCHPQQLSELMIPMTGRKSVGGPVVQ